MARPTGTRNPGYDARRAAMASAMVAALVDDAGAPSSLSALATAAGVSVPTLKHYFGDHDGAVRAALQAAEEAGAVYVARLRDPGDAALADSLAGLAAELVAGWPHGLGALFSGAFTQGLGHAARGPAVVDHLLEPTLQGLEARLAVHRDRGELPADVDLRAAGLAFLSPLLLALLHQHGLSGATCRPLDLHAFAREHTASWVRGWAPG